MSLSVKNKELKTLINLDKMNLRIDMTCQISLWLCTSPDELYNFKIGNHYFYDGYIIYKISDVYGNNFYVDVQGKIKEHYLHIDPDFERELKKIETEYLSLDFKPGYHKRPIFYHDGQIFINKKKIYKKEWYLKIRLHIKNIVVDSINAETFLIINVIKVK
jgi:hypothetical protein